MTGAAPDLGAQLNLRDLASADPARVKSQKAFRSAAPPNRAGADAYEALSSLGVQAVYDFRISGERGALSRSSFTKAAVWRPEETSLAGDPASILNKCLRTTEETRNVMINAYAHMPEVQAPAYSVLLGGLAAGRLPILFHCSAGKDRTGLAAAIILSILGVERDKIFKDYLLTNEAHDAIKARFLDDPKNAPVLDTPYDVWRPMLEASPDYLDAAFATITRRWRSVEDYALQRLGVPPDAVDAIQRRLLR